MKKVYVVDLTDEEREALEELLSRGELRARKANRAHILLLADKKEGWTDKAIAKALHIPARVPWSVPAGASWKAAGSSPH